MAGDRLAEARDAFAEYRAAKAEQPNLFSVPEEPDRSIKRVADSAGRAWLAQTLEVIRSVALALDILTVDDINRAGVPACYDRRALGQAMRAAARRGWIQSTGEYRKSDRPERHHSPVLIWRSRLYAEGPPEGGPTDVTTSHPNHHDGEESVSF